MRARSRIVAAVFALIALFSQYTPAIADAPVMKTSVTITGTSIDVVLNGLSGQSSCTVEINGTATGTLQGVSQGVFVNVNGVQIPDGGSGPSPTITGPGQFAANCAGMAAFKFHPTSVTGSPVITITASEAVGRIIGAGVNGGRTNVVGSAPITVSNSGSTATIAISPLPLPLLYGGTGATAIPSGCLQSSGTVITSTGIACASGSGVAAVTGTGNINVTTGATPVVSITNAPTFLGGTTLGTFNTAATTVFPIVMGNSLGLTNITNGAATAGGVAGDIFSLNNGTTTFFTVNHSGSAGVSNGFAAPGGINAGTSAVTSLTDSGLTSGLCVQTSTGGLLATAAAACGSGTVTSVSGDGVNISSTGGTTPTISITAAPTFAGTITESTLTNQKCLTSNSSKGIATTGEPCPDNSTNGSFVIPAVGSTVTVTVNLPAYFPSLANTPIFITDGTNLMYGLVTAGQGTTSLTVENIGIPTGAVGNTMATAAYLGGGGGPVPVGSGNITVTTTSSIPNVAITNAPTFTTVTASSLSGSRCLDANGSSVIIAAPGACPVNATGATFVIPALGGSVSVTVSNNPAYFPAKNNTPIIISDGTNTMNGLVTAGATTGTLTVTNQGMTAGAIGNTMATSAYVTAGGGGPSLMLHNQGGTRLNGIHVESNNALAVGSSTTATFTYATGFTAAPTCTVSTVGAVAPTMSMNAAPGTSSAVVFNSSTAGTASIMCLGW